MSVYNKFGCVAIAMILAIGAAGQTPVNPITTSRILFPVFATAPAPALGASITRSGNPGPRTVYYWIVAKYPVGDAQMAGPFRGTNGPNSLSGSDFFSIAATLPQGATAYDVLRTSSPVPPSGACTCAVTGGTAVPAGSTVDDQNDALGAYTVNPFDLNSLGLTLTNEVQGAGVSHLILRQFGVFVADLSAGGSSFPLHAPDSTCAGAPSYSFASDPTIGLSFNAVDGFVSLCNADLTVGGITSSSGFTSSFGAFNISPNGTAQFQAITITGNGSCAANGTAANPSVVTCAGTVANAGIFSCDVAASGGTCEVHTEFVRDRDVILVQPVSYPGAVLTVTCNTAPAAMPAITVASVTNGGGGLGKFVVNMPTFAGTPMCYSFQIIGR